MAKPFVEKAEVSVAAIAIHVPTGAPVPDGATEQYLSALTVVL